MSQVHANSQERSSDGSRSDQSSASCKLATTAPTVNSLRPALHHWGTDISTYLAGRLPSSSKAYSDATSVAGSDDAASLLTYTSTAPSEHEFDEDEPGYPVFDDPLGDEYDEYDSSALPSTPSEFADYFPSARRLCIRHDDTIDGNMNLRVDVEIPDSKRGHLDLTLFHLRMHDLKKRDFSLRRYCRSSGHEVCHSSRKYAKPAAELRPTLRRSMGSALAPFRPKSSGSKVPADATLKRADSGNDSISDDDSHGGSPGKQGAARSIPVPTNTMNIEFSNYAHVELKRRGTNGSKRYEFAYWGRSYAWRRETLKNAGSRELSYHLYDSQSAEAVAHIVPVPLTPAETEDEESKGGWVPPSSMWITDPQNSGRLADVADVIMSTGLMALADDSIRQRWHRKDRYQFPIPLPGLPPNSLGTEYIGPKRLIDEVFHRRGSDSTRRATQQQATPL